MKYNLYTLYSIHFDTFAIYYLHFLVILPIEVVGDWMKTVIYRTFFKPVKKYDFSISFWYLLRSS